MSHGVCLAAILDFDIRKLRKLIISITFENVGLIRLSKGARGVQLPTRILK